MTANQNTVGHHMELITRKQAAAILQVRPRTILNWQKKGKIKPACFINNRPRYTLESLEAVATETKVNIIPGK